MSIWFSVLAPPDARLPRILLTLSSFFFFSLVGGLTTYAFEDYSITDSYECINGDLVGVNGVNLGVNIVF